ncbi:MAG: hypothetical protein QOD75_820 [Blastocatellia bacterium]|nr:hypothetical protein [Blastocatellia bacterium]
MTKEELLNGLNNILNNFLYGLMCSRLVTQETWRHVEDHAALFRGPEEEDIRIELGPISRRVTEPDRRERFIRNYENSLLRALVRETHELIILYCEETGQFATYRREPWFQFARILRNIVSHKQGGVLRQWPRDLGERGITEVTWRNRVLNTNMIGNAINFFPFEGLRLLSDQIEFVEARLV